MTRFLPLILVDLAGLYAEKAVAEKRWAIGPVEGLAGGVPVQTIEETKQAAGALGIEYWGGDNGHSSGNDPKGAVYRVPDNDIFFNTHATGSMARNDRKLVYRLSRVADSCTVCSADCCIMCGPLDAAGSGCSAAGCGYDTTTEPPSCCKGRGAQ